MENRELNWLTDCSNRIREMSYKPFRKNDGNVEFKRLEKIE
jgi:hypothetical protein